MVIKKTPYVNYTLDEDKITGQGKVLNIRFNQKELDLLDEDKRLLNIGPDSSMIKLLVDVGRKVIRDRFSEDNWKYIVSRRRKEFSERER
jgi:hypothetical protein